MIDTIEFVLHEVNKQHLDLKAEQGVNYTNSYNRLIYERLMYYESKYIKRTKVFSQQKQHENEPNGNEFVRQKQNVDFVFTHRTGGVHSSSEGSEVYYHRVNGDISSASSDYRVQFSINENTDAITFRMSVPKYFYGTNIVQFVPQIFSTRYQNNVMTMRYFSRQTEHLHRRIIEFIYTFFDDLGVYLNLPSIQNLDISKIEIKIIDFCFNQIFPNQAMVKDYLQAQKKFYQTNLKNNTLLEKELETSLYYRHSTDGFYFKIYEKGEEFQNVDLPKLLKEQENHFNKLWLKHAHEFKDTFAKHFPETFKRLKGKVEDQIFAYYKTYINSNETDKIAYVKDIEKFFKIKLRSMLEISKRILRYEMSFTRTYMSTLYKRHIYRKSCPNWKRLKQNYDKIKRYDLLISQNRLNQAEIYKKKHLVDYGALFRYATDKENAMYSDRAMKQIKRDYDVIHRSLFKKHEFYVKTEARTIQNHESRLSDFELDHHRRNPKYKIEEIKQATFSPELIKIMSEMFETEVKKFIVKEVEETTTILDQIDKYNEKAEKKRLKYIEINGKEKYQKLTHTQKRQNNLVKINKTKLKPIIDQLEKGKALKQAFEYYGISRSQQYIYEDDLKNFKIERQSVKRSFSIFKPKTDFSDYYEKFYTENFKELFINPAMISFDTIRNERQ